jgi:hypothetical protein
MNLKKQDLLQIIKEEMSAIIGEGRMKEMAMEIMDELQALMAKYGIDVGGLQGILSDMDSDVAGADAGVGQEPVMKEAGLAYHDAKDEADMSMTNRLARAMFNELTADVDLGPQDSEEYLLDLQDIAQEYIMPIWNEMQQVQQQQTMQERKDKTKKKVK